MGIDSGEVAPGDPKCFYCGAITMRPCLFWHGHGDPISLHAHCALELTSHLLKDVVVFYMMNGRLGESIGGTHILKLTQSIDRIAISLDRTED